MTGELAIAGPWTPDGSDASRKQAQELAGALAHPSNHPVSKVLASLAGPAIALTNWRGKFPVSGVQAELDSEMVRLGSLSWLRASGIAIPESEKQMEQWKAEEATLVGIAKGNSSTGIFRTERFSEAKCGANRLAPATARAEKHFYSPAIIRGPLSQSPAEIGNRSAENVVRRSAAWSRRRIL